MTDTHRFIQPEYMFPLWRKWHRVKEVDLPEWCEKNKISPADLDEWIGEYQRNPLAFFLPHGRKRRGKYANDGVAFLNEYVKDLLLLRAPNQTGKSALGAVRTMLHLLPCEKSWPIFTQHGVEYHEWGGPQTAIVASYEWSNTFDIWVAAYRKFAPRQELGAYAENWGAMGFEREKDRARVFAQGFKRGVEILNFACGSRIIFLCYHQNLSAWTGKQCDIAHLDEQCPEDLFDELTQRQTTRGDYTPILMTLTPHVVDGKPDTGAAGWIKQKIVDRGMTKGRKFAEFVITMDSVPTALIPAGTKRNKKTQFITEPEALHDEKKMREGRARFYGEWEVGGGIIISAWNPEIHVIAPFDVRKYHPTLYRYIDHGENPCAALLVALMPWGDNVFFAEYYEFGRGIAKNAEGIVEGLCKNTRARVDTAEFEGVTWPIMEERSGRTGMEFHGSELDGRSFASTVKESMRTIGRAYNDYGCRCTPSSNTRNTRTDGMGQVDLFCEFFELDKERVHINEKLGRPVPALCKDYGAPRVYLFSTLTNMRGEIEGWMRNPKTGLAIDKDDHLISCGKWHAGRPRFYQGDGMDGGAMSGDDGAREKRDEFTGY